MQRRNQQRGHGSIAPTIVPPACRTCGVVLQNRRRKLCSGCWSVERRRLATDRARAGGAELSRRRLAGNDPSHNAAAAAKRRESLARSHAVQATWQLGDAAENIDLNDVLPQLGAVPLSRIAAATGLSISACSRIRSGGLRPHARHWSALAELVQHK